MRYTEAFCNREYDNRALVPDYAGHFERWARTARRARGLGASLLDLYYGGTSGQRLDLFPASREGGPLLVFIHGGYWRSMSKSDFSWVAPPFVARGVNVAMIDYDLAPAVSMETIVLQVLRAIEWLWRGSERYGYDASRIFVGGHSAGGHLTAMAMCAIWPAWDPDLPADLIKGGVAISGLYDLEPIRRASFLNKDLKLSEHGAMKLSPVWMPPAGNAPLVTCVGGLESSEFTRQNALIGKRWKRSLSADVPAPGRNHFTVVDALAEPDHPLFAAALAMCQAAPRADR
jgi:arylformamidase